MKVNDLTGALRGVDPRDAQKSDRNPARSVTQNGQTENGDSLELSPVARISTSSVQNIDGQPTESSTLDPARIAEIQSRINSGYYNQPATTAQIADKLLGFYAR